MKPIRASHGFRANLAAHRPASRFTLPTRRQQHPSRHDELDDKPLDNFADLVVGLATDGGYAAARTGSRRPQLEDFALDVKHGARPHQPKPRDF